MSSDLDELRRLSEVAPDGPWQVYRMFGPHGPTEVGQVGNYARGCVSPANPKHAAFIVAAVNHVRQMLAAPPATTEGD